ncbi:MAG TPA: thioredoxin, partial [Anaerolineae bacterium]|nr:thioredoxin [Anaerolineae bacterium]
FLCAAALNPLTLKLSPIAYAVILAYSYTKRFTWLCHLFLGLSLALAPLGGYVAVKGAFTDPAIFVLALGVVFWVAGFDILYACMDEDFDRVVLGSEVPVLVDFWAAWCAPCRMIAPAVERLAAEFAGRALVAKLDVEANPRTAQRYGAISIPTLIFFKEGQEMSRLVGVQPEELLRARLAALL